MADEIWNQSSASATVLAALQNIVTAINGQTQIIRAWKPVAPIASTNLTDTTAPTSFTPTDASGAALAFTAVSVAYTKIGNLVYVYGQLTYPVTASGLFASITLPVAVPNQNYAAVAGSGITSAGPTVLSLQAIPNTSRAAIFSPGAQDTNANLSGAKIYFMLIYPAT